MTEGRASTLAVSAASTPEETAPKVGIAALQLRRRQLGAYFTPDALTRVISEWAIRSPTDQVLEPSFGGCGFLEAAAFRLTELGARFSTANLYGCDIDSSAFEHLERRVPKAPKDHFLLADFLGMKQPKCWPKKFEVVIGNPPYIGYHSLTGAQRSNAAQLAANSSLGIRVPRSASLWAYFLLHSIAQIKEGGRLAFVLPRSFLNADYAAGLREMIPKLFGRCMAVSVRQMLFKSEGTDERTICLFAEDRRHSKNEILPFDEASGVAELANFLNAWKSGHRLGKQANGRSAVALLTSHALPVFDRIQAVSECKSMGEVVSTRIGTVTGANDFFIMNPLKAKALKLPTTSLRPIIPKYAQLKGLEFTEDDFNGNFHNDLACLILSPNPRQKLAKATEQYLSTFPIEKRESNKTFSKRQFWYCADDGKIPDAFISYMHHLGPRLALNLTKTNCTNTIHRGYFAAGTPEVQMKLAAISLLTTFSQISSEIEGRSYGSGVLKHEPSEFGRIRVVLPARDRAMVQASFHTIDQLLRNSKHDEARRVADATILATGQVAASNTELATLEKELLRLRASRQHGHIGSSHSKP